MNFLAKSTSILKQKTQCAVIFAQGKHLLSSAQEIDTELGGTLSHLLDSEDLKLASGNSLWVALNKEQSKKSCQRLMIVQLGENKDNKKNKKNANKSLSVCYQNDLRKAFTQVATKLKSKNVKEACVFLDGIEVDGLDIKESKQWLGHTLAKTVLHHIYTYDTTKDIKHLPSLNKLIVSSSSSAEIKQLSSGLNLGSAAGTGINYARELGNLPGNICTPSYLAQQAKLLAKQSDKLSVKVLNEKQMSSLGMDSLLSVSNGSEEEAKLIVMEYKGKASTKPIVLVGKGITFDTGGISLKPGSAMDEMKFDMCGAASVFGTMKALLEMQAKVNVVAVVAAAENMPSGKATKPGDVVKSMSGQTIEILNTDAEGRLVLCDALTYVERFKPKSVVDIATLTGACVIALGSHATGLYSNDQKLADELLAAGERTYDRAWQMPLWEEYQKQLNSNFADMANIGGREAGSVTAACFLSRYAKKYSWAHLDIAGTAWLGGAKKGATGRPVSLLLDYVTNNA